MRKFRYVYGPVRSRRLGHSLGLDLVPAKTCCYDCVYCQQGRTTNKTFETAEYVPAAAVVEELRAFLADHRGTLDVITLSGSGEPCLNSGAGEVIRAAKEAGVAPVVVLTNGAPLLYESVREAVADADVVIPTLTSVRKETFEAVHRPCAGISPEALLAAWTEFKKRFRGRFEVEVMILAGFNDSEDELAALRDALHGLGPDAVQLNTVERPPTEAFARPVDGRRLREIGDFLDLPYVLPGGAGDAADATEASEAALAERAREILKRRPCGPAELAAALGAGTVATSKVLDAMRRRGEVRVDRRDGQLFFRWSGGTEDER